MPGVEHRVGLEAVGRRHLARMCAGAVFAGAVSGILSACGPTAARTAPRNPRTVIKFNALPPLGKFDVKSVVAIMQDTLVPFYQANPGVYVDVNPFEPPSPTLISQILAGTAPDIVETHTFAPFYQQKLLMPLGSYFKQDNVVPSDLWNRTQFAKYVTPEGPLGVPAYTGTTVYAVNRSIFDALGVAYPAADWTYQKFTQTATALTTTTHKAESHRFGADVFFQNFGPWQGSWLFNAFGGNQVSTTWPPSQLNAAPNLAALRWVYHDMFWPQVGTTSGGGNVTQFLAGTVAMSVMGSWMLFKMVQSGIDKLRWDFVPFPIFPAGRTTFCTANFYGITNISKNPDIAWQLLRWISTQPNWGRMNMHLALYTPALNSLWSEWETVVATVAPSLKGKALSWYGDAASKGYAYPVEEYPYGDAGIQKLTTPDWESLFHHKVGVTLGARNLDQVINAYEAAQRQS